MERNRVIQGNLNDSMSPEPCYNGGMNKCQSTMNIASHNSSESEKNHYSLTKSLSGGNIVKINHANEEKNSGSGISTPSNGSKEDDDK